MLGWRQIPLNPFVWIPFKWRVPAFLLASLSVILLAGDLSARRDNPNPNPVAYLGVGDVPQVVLRENRVFQYVVTGRINGVAVDFLIDTGAADVAMPYGVAQSLGLTLMPGGISKTGNGNVRTWVARLESVDVGGLTVYGLSATVLPNMQGDQILLGMAYLRQMELSLRGGEMTLRPYRTP